jgi:hypothetical protein
MRNDILNDLRKAVDRMKSLTDEELLAEFLISNPDFLKADSSFEDVPSTEEDVLWTIPSYPSVYTFELRKCSTTWGASMEDSSVLAA